MARTRAFQVLKSSIRDALALESRITPDETVSRKITRRSFGTSALCMSIISSVHPPAYSASVRSQPSVAIIGGGMAGVHCAYRLHTQGIKFSLFESSDRIGGRMFSTKGKSPSGQVVEMGGEFIDADHSNIRRLAQEFGIPLDNIRGDSIANLSRFFIDDRWVSNDELAEAARPLTRQISQDLERARNNPNEYDRLDRMNIVQWLDKCDGLEPFFRKLLIATYTADFGLEADEQSALNLLEYTDTENFTLYHEANERYRVHGGNGTLPQAVAERLPKESLNVGTRLLSISNSNRTYKLTFETDSGNSEFMFDLVVLAVPFTTLRNVELRVEIDERKRWIIDHLGYGKNAKLMGGFTERIWRTANKHDGEVFADEAFQECWDTSRGQPGTSGIITNFIGGNLAVASNRGTPDDRYQLCLKSLESFWHGISRKYIGNSAVRMHWSSNPNALGSYSCYLPGQWQYAGEERRRVDNLFFCGEHTAGSVAGYMEGACKSGARVAREILSTINLKDRARNVPNYD